MELEFGKKYKYKDLCLALNEEPKSGGYQTNQLNTLRNYYDIEKTDDKKYIVHKKYNEVEIIQQKKYHIKKAYLTPIIYTMLSNTKDNVLRTTTKDLMIDLAIVNKDYNYAKWNSEKVDQHLLDGEIGGLNLFIEETEQIYKRMIKDILNDMESRKLISQNKIIMFAFKSRDPITNKIYTMTREADKEFEIPIFLEGQRLAMSCFGLEHYEDMSKLNYFQIKESKKIIERYLFEQLGVSYFYNDYEIILNKTGIEEYITENYSDMRIEFNKYIQNKTLTSQSGSLKHIDNQDKKKYNDALIDIGTDLGLRYKL